MVTSRLERSMNSLLGRLSMVLCCAAVFGLAGCGGLYYSTMEKLGKEKREILVDRIEDAREDQEEAKEQFASALDRFQAVLGTRGGELEKQYRQLDSEYKACESRANDVRERISSIDDVSGALFKEWEKELEQYSRADLRTASERQLRETRARYDTMMAAMRRASDKMQPVLGAFSDHVLFLKHNLNAQAIASLQGDAGAIEDDVALLIADMEKSIAEADAFLAQMEGTK